MKVNAAAFRRSHVATDADAELASLVFVLDLQETAHAVPRLRDWAMDRLAPAPGETAVDVGCGTGTEVRRFAGLVGQIGRAVGVEPHEGLRAVAEERSAGTTAQYLDGDATALPFDDGTVDVLRCERVWQHLDDPEQAAREVARVLAPGGRAAILDSDWATWIANPADPEFWRRFNDAFCARMANPFAGRLVRGQLWAAGLTVDDDVGSAALVMPDDVVRNPALFRASAALAIEEGVLTEDEVEVQERVMVEAVERGDAFLSVTMYAFIGRR